MASVRFRAATADGEWRWFEARGEPYELPDGTLAPVRVEELDDPVLARAYDRQRLDRHLAYLLVDELVAQIKDDIATARQLTAARTPDPEAGAALDRDVTQPSQRASHSGLVTTVSGRACSAFSLS